MNAGAIVTSTPAPVEGTGDAALFNPARRKRQTFILLGAALVVASAIGWFSMPFVLAYTRVSLEQKDLATATIDRVVANATAMRPLTLLTTPVAEVVKISVVAGFILMFFFFAAAEVSFAQAFLIACRIEAVALVKRLVVLLVLTGRGIASVHTAADLEPPVGLDLLVGPGEALWSRLLLSFANPFDLAVIGILCWSARTRTSDITKVIQVALGMASILIAARALTLKFASV